MQVCFRPTSRHLLLEIKISTYKNLCILFERILLSIVGQGGSVQTVQETKCATRRKREICWNPAIINSHAWSEWCKQTHASGPGRRPEAIHACQAAAADRTCVAPLADRSVSDQCDRDAMFRRELACVSIRSQCVALPLWPCRGLPYAAALALCLTTTGG